MVKVGYMPRKVLEWVVIQTSPRHVPVLLSTGTLKDSELSLVKFLNTGARLWPSDHKSFIKGAGKGDR